jgi:antitoxin HicB
VTKTKNPHWGSTLDEFLDEEGAREAFQAVAIKEVLSWQIAEAMKSQGISRKKLAERMGTSYFPAQNSCFRIKQCL